MTFESDLPLPHQPSVLDNLSAEDRREHWVKSTRIRIGNEMDSMRGVNLQEQFIRKVEAAAIDQYGVSEVSERTLRSIAGVDRGQFVPPELKVYARQTVALPIGEGQTTSAPQTVAVMMDLLDIEHDSTILEIGAGSGHTAAVMAQITNETIPSLEIRPNIRALATTNLKAAGVDTVQVADSESFWNYDPNRTPGIALQHFPETYDRIVCCAEMEGANEADVYIDKLSPDGRLVAPIKAIDGKVYFYVYTHTDGWTNQGIKPR